MNRITPRTMAGPRHRPPQPQRCYSGTNLPPLGSWPPLGPRPLHACPPFTHARPSPPLPPHPPPPTPHPPSHPPRLPPQAHVGHGPPQPQRVLQGCGLATLAPPARHGCRTLNGGLTQADQLRRL